MTNQLATITKNLDLSIYQDDMSQNDILMTGLAEKFPTIKLEGK